MRHISPRGRLLVTACFVTGGALLTGAPEGSGGVGWIAAVIATMGGAAVCLVLGMLGRRAPDREFFGAVDDAAGRVVGGVTAVVVALLALAMLVRDLAVITQFVGANMMPKTPHALITFGIAAAAAWCASEGRSAVGRWAELAAMVAGIALAAALGFASGDFDSEAVVRGVRRDMDGLFGGAVALFGECTGGILLCAATLFPFGRDERRRSLPPLIGMCIGGALTAVVLLFNTALLGADTLTLYNFPTYHALRVSGIRGVLERMEALLLVPAVTTSFLRAAVELVAIAGAAVRLFPKLDGRRSPAVVAAAVGGVASVALVSNQVELGAIEAAAAAPYAIALAAVTAVAALCAIIRRRT